MDGAEPVRPLGITEAGMPRDDDPPVPRQSVEEIPVLREIVDAVKKQQGRTVSGRQQLDRNFIDLDALHGVPLPGPLGMIVIPWRGLAETYSPMRHFVLSSCAWRLLLATAPIMRGP